MITVASLIEYLSKEDATKKVILCVNCGSYIPFKADSVSQEGNVILISGDYVYNELSDA